MPRVWNKRDPNVPPDAVYVGRPSKWGNDFKIGDMDRATVIEHFRLSIQAPALMAEMLTMA